MRNVPIRINVNQILSVDLEHSILPAVGRWLFVLLATMCIFAAAPIEIYADELAIWKALKSKNHFAILRHAIAPGSGDPGHFKIDDCTTQRNLSTEGRKQAEEIGTRFRANGMDKVRLFSSQWCRCLETARVMALGPVRQLPELNSFFQKFAREASQTQELKAWLSEQDLTKPLVLVTHQVNITALTGVYPASGEMIVVRRTNTGEIVVAGRIRFE